MRDCSVHVFTLPHLFSSVKLSSTPPFFTDNIQFSNTGGGGGKLEGGGGWMDD